MDESIFPLTLIEACAAIRAGQLSPLELTKAYLARIELLNPMLNAYLEVAMGSALEQARAATEALMRRIPLEPLHGIPVAVKDLFDVQGMHTTAGSILLKDNNAGPFRHGIISDDAVVIQKLRRAGAIFLGKTNMHEWALGVTTINPHFGTCINPWGPGGVLDDKTGRRGEPAGSHNIAGGSSGGSAAALAAGLCLGSVGTDTGGSIRIPSSLCGTVGLKSTYGRISLRGVVPLSRSLDHAGPMARTVEDVALLLGVIAGYDAEDPASMDRPVENFAARLKSISAPLKLQVGVPDQNFVSNVDPGVESAVRKAIMVFEELGCEIREVSCAGDAGRPDWSPDKPSLAGHEAASEASAKILLAEAAAFHRDRLQEHPDQFGPDVLMRLRQGMEISSIDYAQARRTQAEWHCKMARLFEAIDLLVLPATPIPAPTIAECSRVPHVTAQLTRFMRLFNLTGHPALVLPCGLTAAGLPIGLQIVGPHWGETKVLQLGNAFESATEWHKLRPGVL